MRADKHKAYWCWVGCGDALGVAALILAARAGRAQRVRQGQSLGRIRVEGPHGGVDAALHHAGCHTFLCAPPSRRAHTYTRMRALSHTQLPVPFSPSSFFLNCHRHTTHCAAHWHPS